MFEVIPFNGRYHFSVGARSATLFLVLFLLAVSAGVGAGMTYVVSGILRDSIAATERNRVGVLEATRQAEELRLAVRSVAKNCGITLANEL